MSGGISVTARIVLRSGTSCDGERNESEILIVHMVLCSLLPVSDITRTSTCGPAIAAVSNRKRQKTAEVVVSVRQKTTHMMIQFTFSRFFFVQNRTEPFARNQLQYLLRGSLYF
jgi:hypothetical protein